MSMSRRTDLAGLYQEAEIYWHGTGLGTDLEQEPEKAEHFGISLVEAMSAGCVVFAYGSGGPREIITDGVDGFLYSSTEDLGAADAPAAHRRANSSGRRSAAPRAAGPPTSPSSRFNSQVRGLADHGAGEEACADPANLVCRQPSFDECCILCVPWIRPCG